MRGNTLSEKARRYLRYIYLRLVRVHDAPKKVAGGFALGVFLGVFPTFGIAIPLSYVLATLFRINRAAAITGSLIMNPFTTPLFWSLSAAVGAALFKEDTKMVLSAWEQGEKLTSMTKGALIYLTGNLIVSTATAGLSFALALFLVKKHRERKRSKPR